MAKNKTRREASPSIDVDKSIKSIKAPAESVDFSPRSQHTAQDAGISKKKKQKPLSRAQRARQQKAIERADRNFDVLEQNVMKSKARARRTEGRRAEWRDLNEKIIDVTKKNVPVSDWVDVDDDDESSTDEAKSLAIKKALPEHMPGDEGLTDGKAADAGPVLDEEIDEVL
ncbi:hypothetical protein MBLNU459_g2914t2 [Dothideomycetes sp. NU459]